MFVEPFKIDVNEGTVELGISIIVHDNHAHTAAKDWAFNEWEPKLKEDPDFIIYAKNIDLSGVHGYKIKVFGFDRNNYHIYMPKGGRMYEVYFEDPLSVPELSEALQKHYDKLFRRIVNTFRFR